MPNVPVLQSLLLFLLRCIFAYSLGMCPSPCVQRFELARVMWAGRAHVVATYRPRVWPMLRGVAPSAAGCHRTHLWTDRDPIGAGGAPLSTRRALDQPRLARLPSHEMSWEVPCHQVVEEHRPCWCAVELAARICCGSNPQARDPTCHPLMHGSSAACGCIHLYVGSDVVGGRAKKFRAHVCSSLCAGH